MQLVGFHPVQNLQPAQPFAPIYFSIHILQNCNTNNQDHLV